MRLRRLTLAVATLIVMGAGRRGAQDATDRTLLDLDRQLQEASVSGDAALLERHLSEDFAFTHFGGQRDNKAFWVERARLPQRPFLRRAVSEQQVETHGDVALVLGRLDVQTAPRPGQAAASSSCYALRYLHAYARREGRWMFLSHHTTAMIQESRPCS